MRKFLILAAVATLTACGGYTDAQLIERDPVTGYFVYACNIDAPYNRSLTTKSLGGAFGAMASVESIRRGGDGNPDTDCGQW